MNAKYREHLLSVLLLVTLLLGGCAGMPIGPNEMPAISQGATVAGTYAVKAGLEPLAQILENPTGSQILFWPGARTTAEQLWNMTCLVKCVPGWQNEVEYYVAANARTMTGEKASSVARALLNSGYWKQVPLSAGTALQFGISFVGNFGRNWYTISAAGVIVVPETIEGPQT